jgi:hypothetical protein
VPYIYAAAKTDGWTMAAGLHGNLPLSVTTSSGGRVCSSGGGLHHAVLNSNSIIS